MARSRSFAAFAVCSLAAALARADVVFDSSLGEPGPAPAGVVGTTAVDYRIGAERGQLRGGNLFFSFQRFSIELGRIGAFDGPVGVENVLARVTAGDLSRIDGLLGSAITGADGTLDVLPAEFADAPLGEDEGPEDEACR